MNRELFRKQIECAVHRAKLRGIRFSTSHGWGWERKNGKVVLRNPTYILSMFIEGMRSEPGKYIAENKLAAKTLRVDPVITQCFSNGFCGMPEKELQQLAEAGDGDNEFATRLGVEFRRLCLGA